jgi:CopG family nickel-responsive transcriptional regulator
MEVAVLKGLAATVGKFAEQVIAERGVKHGRLVMVPVKLASERHVHGKEESHPHEHVHVR